MPGAIAVAPASAIAAVLGIVRTTRALGANGPARLWFEEDSFRDDAAVAVPVDGHPARVIEITGPDDWAALCRQHPLDVSAARRHDWYRVTGRVGSWVIPDWRSVAAEADAVHLTVLGYLTAATRPIDVDGERATVLAGWNPDETFWFRGTLARPADEQADDPLAADARIAEHRSLGGGTGAPLAHGRRADPEVGGDGAHGLPLAAHAIHHQRSTERRGARIVMQVHPAAPRRGWLAVTTNLPPEPRMGNNLLQQHS